MAKLYTPVTVKVTVAAMDSSSGKCSTGHGEGVTNVFTYTLVDHMDYIHVCKMLATLLVKKDYPEYENGLQGYLENMVWDMAGEDESNSQFWPNDSQTVIIEQISN